MILKDIGHGGMADVYLALDTLLNREVAIKILRGELCSDPISLLRFKREAQASCALIHPNIVEIYDVGEDEGQHFIVMEHVKGQTLKELIIKRGALLKEEAVDVMKQLVSATCEAHKKGIIHRDIKPQNVIVKTDGTIKMLDFGIALAHDALQLTQTDSVLGSVHYLAPELARGENASFQSDIYSLGLVFYELLSGEVPFKGETPVQIALKHMRDEIPSIKTYLPNLPQSLENIILKATVKRKDFRYTSAAQMLKDFTTALTIERINEKKITFDYVQTDDDKTKQVVPVKKSNKSPIKIEQSKKPKKRNEKNSVFVYSLWAILCTLGIFGVALVLFFVSPFKGNDTVIVPNCSGKTIEQCENLLLDSTIILDTSATQFEITDDIAEGIIISTIPAADGEVQIGTSMRLVISSGQWQVMKNYVGQNGKEAENDIKNEYSNVRVRLIEEESLGSTPGIVLRQELIAPDEKFSPKSQVDLNLIIAAYPNFLIPNNISKMDINDAKENLESMGAKVMFENLEIPTDEDVEEGVVVKTSPSIGTWYTQEESNYITIYYY